MIRTSPLTASTLIATYGVTRPMVRSVMYNRFNLPQDYTICMSYYRIKVWDSEVFQSYRTADGQIKSGDPACPELFNIIYQFCTPTQVRKSAKVHISFRLAHDSFNIEPIAIVRIS